MSKVSFIIPYYNVPTALLRECVESILALPLTDDEREIIVVDDGSDESPVLALEDYGEAVAIVRQENGGLSAARNAGIELATGEYIQFVDADDCLIRDAYAVCLKVVKEEQPDIVLFTFTNDKPPLTPPLENEGNSSHSTLHTPHFTLHTKDFLSTHNLRASVCCYLFRREILGDLRFTPRLLHEDEEFTPLLFLRAHSLVETSLQAYYYREREDSIVHSPDAAHLRKRLDDMERIIRRLSQEEGLKRRTAQLTMDYIYNTLTLLPNECSERIERLKSNGLYPLPLRRYTWKYWLFSLVANILSPLL